MRTFLLIFFTCLAAGTVAQKTLKSLTLIDKTVFATVDRPGDLYIVSKGGRIQKFNVDGTLISEYKTGPAPTLFDARDGARLFAYFRDDQYYAYLNPSFDVTAKHAIDPALTIKPWLVCASGDHNIWILDGEDKSIKRINNTTSGVDVDIRLDFSDKFRLTYMREYQGFLFLLDLDEGIRIFSNMGKPLMTLGYPGLASFNFFGEELYYVVGNNLRLFNLFTAHTREIPLAKGGEFVLMTDVRLFSVLGNKAEILTFTP